MRPGRLFPTFAALLVSSTFAFATRGDTSYEAAVQYSLEHLTSGVSTAFLVNGNEVMVMPMRTWKSVSGHYCRQYEITVTKPASGPDRTGSIRCRDGDGVWKKLKEDDALRDADLLAPLSALGFAG